jgi:predicted nucleic acid-binding protein
MSNFLLDSNVIINFLLNRASTVKLINEFLHSGDSLVTSAICIAEVQLGVRENEKEKTDLFADSLEVFDITVETGRIGAFYVCEYKKKGVTLNLIDCLIAATCVLNNLILVTYNKRHFEIPELKLYDMKDC